MNSTKNHTLISISLILIVYIVFLSLFGFRKQVPLRLEDEFPIFSRPYNASSIKSAFVGPWIPAGLKDTIRNYYRPFSIVAYAWLYDLCGHNTSELYLVRMLFSLIKFAAFFGVLFLLTNRSLFTAFSATLLYTISFKIFDEQVVFQCLPDIIVATTFFTALFLYILLSSRQFGLLQTTGLVAGIILIYTIGLGTKENAFFLVPTLLFYRLIYSYSHWKGPFQRTIRVIFERKQLILFSALSVISIVYFIARYHSLGTQYIISNSYRTGNNALRVAMLNIINNFALIPITYLDHPFALNDLIEIGKCLSNLALPSFAIYLLFRKDVHIELKKGILFSLVLILLNTSFYTQLVRARFNSIGNLGSIYIVIGIAHIIYSFRNKAKYPYNLLVSSITIACLSIYTIQNTTNILNRQHPTQVVLRNR